MRVRIFFFKLKDEASGWKVLTYELSSIFTKAFFFKVEAQIEIIDQAPYGP